jgi:hypothetical protein
MTESNPWKPDPANSPFPEDQRDSLAPLGSAAAGGQLAGGGP